MTFNPEKCLFSLKEKKMPESIKVCKCFLDVAVYCLALSSIRDLLYADFFHRCFQVKYNKINSYMMRCTRISNDDCYIACCTKFICVKLENSSILDYINSAMAGNCFYYDNDSNEDSTVTCINANFDDKKKLMISVFLVKELFYIILAANYALSKIFPFS